MNPVNRSALTSLPYASYPSAEKSSAPYISTWQRCTYPHLLMGNLSSYLQRSRKTGFCLKPRKFRSVTVSKCRLEWKRFKENLTDGTLRCNRSTCTSAYLSRPSIYELKCLWLVHLCSESRSQAGGPRIGVPHNSLSQREL